MEPYIRVADLTKTFEGSRVLASINLSLPKGQIHGIIGRNGSGKTVLLKCLCGLLKPSSGEVYIDNKKVCYGKKQNTAAIIEVPGFIDHVSGIKNLEYLAEINQRIGKTQIRQTMRAVGLDPESKKKVGKYSLGMRQRLAIAQAIMEDMPLIVFDEPMNGLDNQGVEEVRKILKNQRDGGKTIIIASHNREDISLLCDTVTELDHGSIIRQSNY